MIADPIAAPRVLSQARRDEIVILSESTRQDWPPLSTRPELDFTLVGPMGKASSFGLGLALARPNQRVWVLDTDGALLMNLGALVTVARARPANLLHFVYDNEAYDTTGGQPTPGTGIVDWQAIASGAGYPCVRIYDELEPFSRDLPSLLTSAGPMLIVLKVASLGRRPTAGNFRPMSEQFEAIRARLAAS